MDRFDFFVWILKSLIGKYESFQLPITDLASYCYNESGKEHCYFTNTIIRYVERLHCDCKYLNVDIDITKNLLTVD